MTYEVSFAHNGKISEEQLSRSLLPRLREVISRTMQTAPSNIQTQASRYPTLDVRKCDIEVIVEANPWPESFISTAWRRQQIFDGIRRSLDDHLSLFIWLGGGNSCTEAKEVFATLRQGGSPPITAELWAVMDHIVTCRNCCETWLDLERRTAS